MESAGSTVHRLALSPDPATRGDWREDVAYRFGSAIRIHSPSEAATNRIYTLMHDPQYRVPISWQNVAYDPPPHLRLDLEMRNPD